MADSFTVSTSTTGTAGIYFWGYGWAYGVFSTLAVWCAGLDCGDHKVRANGSVFVPWRSDPDGLFTPAYLIAQNAADNFPGTTAYGATACNIDFHYNGVLTRVITGLAIGVPYTSQLQLLRPNVPATAQTRTGPTVGETRRVHMASAIFQNSGPPKLGTSAANAIQVTFRQPNQAPYLFSQPFSGVYWDTLPDDYGFDGMIYAEITRPYPLTLSSLGGFLHTSERTGKGDS